MSVFYLIYALWFLSEIFLNRLFRSGTGDQQNQDRGSLRLIWITIGIGNTLGILLPAWVHLPISHNAIVQYGGLSIIVLGMILRFVAIWSLGRMFTVDVTIRADHQLKQTGLYRYLRHPSYTGSILSFIGFGLTINNWLSLVIIAGAVSVAMLHRIKLEEQVLLEQFGEEYSDYQKMTKRLIPGIY